MRRRKEEARRIRVKILQYRKDGMTYREIEQKAGASSATIARILNGVEDPKRFCKICGETDPEKLEEHHPDRTNQPGVTETLCGSCHAKITREEQRRRNREKKMSLASPTASEPAQISLQQAGHIAEKVGSPPLQRSRPLTPSERRQLEQALFYMGGAFSTGEGLFNTRLPGWVRVLLVSFGVTLFYAGSKVE